ncbi:MAG: Na+/H+ antiporter NhaA [Propionicimonas sp.]|nr:Na+/H+ antiporter NhaA [Propionicimonas sp.]
MTAAVVGRERGVRSLAATGRRLRRTPEAIRGAVVLLSATLVALVWANLPGAGYDAFWHLPLGIQAGGLELELDLRHWVNEALMAFFFALLTLEVRREIELGELRDWRRASVPLVAAVAGLVLPALLYVWVTWATDAVVGWGIVVSTDTAFVLGLLALVGRAMPASLRVFLVTLAVADDVGALGVIAFAYTDDFDPAPLLLVAAGLGAIAAMRFLRVWRGPVYLLPSAVVWLGFLLSGVHATLAGVAIAALLPIFATRHEDVRRAHDQVRAFQMTPSAEHARTAEESLARAVSINERAHRALAPYVAWLILPVFALANAGVPVTPQSLADAFGSPLTWGIIAGLVVGKAVAISLSAWAATRLRLGALAPGLRLSHVVGVSLLSGMGFTISLFVADLAFDDPVDVGRAQLGVLAASTLAAVLGAVAFAVLNRRERRLAPDPGRLVRPLDPERDHVLGDPSLAVVGVVAYGDFATPFAPRADEMRQEMRRRFGSRVAFTLRHHAAGQPFGRAAALATEAAARQGLFWEMHDALVGEAPIEAETQLRRAAARAGLNLRRFERDLASSAGATRVDEDFADAAAMQLRQAPTYFIDGRRYDGPIDAESLIGAVRTRAEAVRSGGDHPKGYRGGPSSSRSS